VSLPDPFVDLFKVDDPSPIERERYSMDPLYHHRAQLVHRQLLEAWKPVLDLMGDDERRLFWQKLLSLAMHIVTNSTVMEVRR
jgi:hypothetical protein